jgi:hypothetical protein
MEFLLPITHSTATVNGDEIFSPSFGGEVVSALASHLEGRRFKPE